MYPIRVLAPLALGVALATAPAAFAQAPAPQSGPAAPARISVVGEGQASRAPDIAVTRLTVMRTAETAAAALDAANAAVAEVTAAMPAFGIESRDMQTAGFQVTPQYRYANNQDGTQAPPTITGYEVRNTLAVKVRDLARLGALLDKSVQLGVNEGGSIDFQFDDPSEVMNEARRDAVSQARASAGILAEAAGLKLGRIVAIEDGASAVVPPVPLADMRLAMAPARAEKVPVEIGENTVSASVRIVYELQN